VLSYRNIVTFLARADEIVHSSPLLESGNGEYLYGLLIPTTHLSHHKTSPYGWNPHDTPSYLAPRHNIVFIETTLHRWILSFFGHPHGCLTRSVDLQGKKFKRGGTASSVQKHSSYRLVGPLLGTSIRDVPQTLKNLRVVVQHLCSWDKQYWYHR